MIRDNDKRPRADLLRSYQQIVISKHPARVGSWPLLVGWNLLRGSFKDWYIDVFIDKGFAGSGMTQSTGVGQLPPDVVGETEITQENREAVRNRLGQHFDITAKDAVVLFPPDGNIAPELEAMLLRHELALGIAPMDIFLSHKGFDKPLVRRFRDTLRLLGFSPWLDEDRMVAGTNLERGILE